MIVRIGPVPMKWIGEPGLHRCYIASRYSGFVNRGEVSGLWWWRAWLFGGERIRCGVESTHADAKRAVIKWLSKGGSKWRERKIHLIRADDPQRTACSVSYFEKLSTSSDLEKVTCIQCLRAEKDGWFGWKEEKSR